MAWNSEPQSKTVRAECSVLLSTLRRLMGIGCANGFSTRFGGAQGKARNYRADAKCHVFCNSAPNQRARVLLDTR